MKPFPLPIALAVAMLAGCATPMQASRVPAVSNAVSPARGIVAAGRLAPADIDRLRDAGIRDVIDLTPDAETPDFDEAAAVQAAGMAYANLPLRGAADLTPDNVRRYDRLLRDARRPLLVHCASGNRVGAITALRAAWVDGRSVDDAIAIGRAWGLKGLEGEVRNRLAAGSAAAASAP